MPRYSDDFIEQVREANDIADVIGEYVALKSSGKSLMGLCPFHNEKTPSFSIHQEKQIFRCFSCHVGGNVIHFIMKIQNLQFPQAIQVLAERARIPLPKTESDEKQDASKTERDQIYKLNDFARMYFHQILLSSANAENARKYMTDKRKVSLDTIKRFHLGYAKPDWDDFMQAALKKGYSNYLMEKAGLISPRQSGGTGFYDRFRDQIMFPIVDAQGHVTGFGGRFMDNREPKYLNSPETPVFSKSRSLYALPQAVNEIREQKFAIVMEGYMDVLRAHQCDVCNAVATLGTALTFEQAKLLKRFSSDVVLMYDTDTAGIQAALRGLEPLITMGLNVKVVTLPSGKDPDDYLQENSKEEFYEVIGKAKPPLEFALDLMVQQFGLNSIQGSVNIVSGMFPFLEIMERNSRLVEMELYKKTIADRVNLDVKVVSDQYKQFKRKTGTQRKNITPAVDGFAVLTTGKINAEEEVLKLLLVRPDFTPAFKEFLDVDYFTSPIHRKIAEVLFSISNNESKGKSIPWLNYFIEEEMSTVVTEMILDAENIINPEDTLEAYIRKFQQQKTKHEQQLLKEKIKRAEEVGDRLLLTELQGKFIQLQQSMLTSAKASSS